MDKCSVPECDNEAVAFDIDWDALECEEHLGWWAKQGETCVRLEDIFPGLTS